MPRSKNLSSSFFVPSLCCSYPHVPWGQMDYLLRERKAASSEEENRQLVDGKGVKQQRAIAEKGDRTREFASYFEELSTQKVSKLLWWMTSELFMWHQRDYTCPICVCVCVFLCVCSHCYCQDQLLSVYVCCTEFPLLNCVEAKQLPSVNQAERAAYPATGSRTCQGDHIHRHIRIRTMGVPYSPWLTSTHQLTN